VEGAGDYELMATTDEYAAAAAEFDAATAGEGDAPKDNGEVSSTLNDLLIIPRTSAVRIFEILDGIN